MSLTDRQLNEHIIASNIDRDPVGRTLTPAARDRAIQFGTDAWRGNMGNGTAAQLGIQHATADTIRRDR